MTVSVTASAPMPVPLGTVVTWNAAVAGASAGTLAYRFRIGRAGGNLRTIVDYGPKTSLSWGTIEHTGDYQVEVSVKNNATGEVTAASTTLLQSPLVSASVPVVTPTSNALVFIYSAPGCGEGRMRVDFFASDGVVQSTPFKTCSRESTMNFYLAGLRSGTQYTAQHFVVTGTSYAPGPAVLFTTGNAASQPPAAALITSLNDPPASGILLQSLFFRNSIATDLSGNVVWYGPSDVTYLTRPQTGGTFLGLGEDGTMDQSHQFFREFDLAGNTLAETNAARVNEQLAARGVHPIDGFHHEARKLPDGKYLVLADTERILTDVQGPGAADVIGDAILVLDSDLQVVWTWDAFDHLDPHRTALLQETCTYPAGVACPPFYLSPMANDWLHGNSLQLTPDGNILYSVRHQDWVVKIDYENGAGNGNILWRLGNQGDFQIVSSDPSPWFSHQHDANFLSDGTSLLLFDDGNQRAVTDPSLHSRGQDLQIDEQNRVATLVLNADVGTYSQAVGSAQALPGGDFHFDSGFIYVADASGKVISTIAQSVETDAGGNIVYAIQFGAPEYRSFRMPDMYTAP